MEALVEAQCKALRGNWRNRTNVRLDVAIGNTVPNVRPRVAIGDTL
jgi:hypothetical protein